MKRMRLHHLPAPVARVLGLFYGLTRLYRFLAILGSAVLLYLALALVAMHADRFLFLAPESRVLMSRLVHGLAGAFLLVRLAVFAVRRPSLRRTAYDMQARLPDRAAEQYVTLDSVLREPEDGENTVRRELLGQLTASTAEHSAGVRPFRLVRDRGLAVTGIWLAAMAILYGLLTLVPGYQFPLMLRRFLQPDANLPKPSFVTVRVTPDEVVVGRGGEIVIQVESQGRIPPGLGWLCRLAGAVPNRCVMAQRPGLQSDVRIDLAAATDLNRVQRQLFLYTQADLQESFSYRLRCGDAETEVRFVDVVAQPRVTEMRIRITPPAYTRLPAEEIVDPKQPVRLYEGSAVELVFTVDQPVSNRQVIAGRKEIAVKEWDEKALTGRHAFTMGDKVDLEVRVVNARGFANAERVRVSLVKLEDQSPTVLLEFPPNELSVAPGELVPLQALAEDDLEVSSASVRFQLNPELNPDAPMQEAAITIPDPAGTRVSLTENVDLGQTPAGPGDEILLVVRVRDSKGNDGESRPVRIKVNSFARGENERRRLDAMDIVRDGLALLTAVPEGEEKERATQLTKKAAEKGVALEEPATLDGLLRLIELEQHFTDSSRHKEDVRLLAGVIDFSRTGESMTPDAAQAWPTVLVRDVLTPMIASRRLQNVTWRLFGMQYEIADIRKRLQGAEADANSLKKVQRQALESFLEAVAEEAGKGQPVQAAVRKELDLRKAISEVKARAAPQTEGEVPDNPFAPLRLDVEAAKLSPADEKAVADLNLALKAATAERKRLSGTAVAAVTATWLAGRKGQPIPLEKSEMGTLAASLYDRIVSPPPGAEAVAGPEGRRQLVAALAAERLKDREDSDDSARKSLQRRAELYLKALENIGVDLAGVAESSPGRLNMDKLKSLQGELNTAGYYLSRANMEKGVASCDEVVVLLDRLLAEVRPALPALLRDEHRARELLAARAEAVRHELEAGHVPKGGQDWSRNWVETDLRMLERNPFAPNWPRAASLALEAALEQGPGTNKPAVYAAAVTTAIRDERRFWNLMAAEWELGELQASTRVSPAEKDLAARLIEFAILLESDPLAADALEKTLKQTATGRPVAAADPAAGLRKQRQAMSLPAIDAVLAPVIRGMLPRTPLEVAKEGRARMEEAAKAVDALEAALTAVDAGVTNSIFKATDSLRDAVRSCERAMRLAALQAGALEPLGPEAVQQDLLMLRIREAVDRYRGRAGESVRVMREMAGGEPDAAQLGNLGADLTIVKAGVQALQNNLAAAVDGYAVVDGERQYPIMDTFKETRGWLREAGDLVRKGPPAEVAARFLRDSPFARMEYLAVRSVTLEAALQDLAAVEKLLEQPGADAAPVKAKLESARAGLAAFLDAVSKMGTDDDFQNGVRKGVADLAARLDRVLKGGEADDKRRFLAVAEAGKDGGRLLRRLRSESAASAAEKLEYAGGPDRIWLQDTRLHAEVSRQRLIGQVAWGRRAFTAAMLEALEPAPQAARYADAEAWSLFCHRVVRSPLSGAVIPPRSEAGGDSTRNPLVKWLLEQVDEAAKETQSEETLRNYRGITRELIPSLKDFLRY